MRYAAIPVYDGDTRGITDNVYAVCPVTNPEGGERSLVTGTRQYCEAVADILNRG